MEETPETVRPVAVCESCFLSDHARWEPESMDDSGSILMKLVGVDVPIKINNGSVEVCGLCGGITVSGIYEFKSSNDIFFENNGDNNYELELPEFDLEDDTD